MNQHLKNIQDLLQQNKQLSEQDKESLLKALTDADKQWSITEFKLDRTEKVKKTTAILLEETIGELEQKRKAVEVQNRELEIESSLEKVRTVAMGMRNRDDMLDICRTMSEQLELLGIKEIRNVQTAIFYKDKEIYVNYEYYRLHDKALVTDVDYTTDQLSSVFAAHMMKGPDEFFTRSLAGKEVKGWYNFQKTTNVFIDTYLEKAESLTYYWFSLGPVALGMSSYLPLSEGDLNLFKRFRNVFGLAYQRYIDIEKAEAQAHEAKIEASLERMRAVAMSMRKSEELIAVCESMYKELTVLGFTNIRNAQIAIKHDEKQAYLICEYSDYAVNILQEAPYDSSAIVRELYNELGKSSSALYQKEFSGKEFEDWRTWRKSIKDSIDIRIDEAVSMCFYLFSMGTGHVGISTFNTITIKQIEILKRFKNVFELSYRRYTDVAKAEAQAREAKIEAALERVRARALAMQQPEELKNVAQVLRTEMGLLGVEELETCSIYIHADNSDNAECWYALKDQKQTEKRMVSDHFALDLKDTWVGRQMLQFYNSDEKQTSIVMTGVNRREWIEYCYKHSPEFTGFYGETIPDRTYHLYKFSHGAIGAAAPGDISEESWRMLIRAASVFSLAYSRFKDLSQARTDLIKLKEEKKRAEDALTELQATQKQLIQSEKMASLGELTAGIAHEIQNPLNFVNNFSDVSNELLEEMKTELEKGNTKDAMAIADDVKQNLEKILHHGKRADTIVKGMLQHSRTSSGQKELTDINALADEYLRLAYHGLRAKDKIFNAAMKTDYDENIGLVKIIPQDMGRVILNLITNAFYTVTEKKKNQPGGYEPVVTLSTKKINDKVEVHVIDNGNGIPQKVLDKIFQPFFTTKPTGQGTGLGLSLSYDIVTKGHGGELKVETKEGEGSEFIILLPAT